MNMTDHPFPPTSRYHGLPITAHTLPDGRQIAILGRRFVPSPANFTTLMEHTVKEGERLDNLTANFLGDPEQFWRVCDANHALDPADLTAFPGQSLRITLPEGIPAQPHA